MQGEERRQRQGENLAEFSPCRVNLVQIPAGLSHVLGALTQRLRAQLCEACAWPRPCGSSKCEHTYLGGDTGWGEVLQTVSHKTHSSREPLWSTALSGFRRSTHVLELPGLP